LEDRQIESAISHLCREYPRADFENVAILEDERDGIAADSQHRCGLALDTLHCLGIGIYTVIAGTSLIDGSQKGGNRDWLF
jgi:hypothetical protein